MHTIGFIGASGLMGHGMARHLLAHGHALHITVHRNTERGLPDGLHFRMWRHGHGRGCQRLHDGCNNGRLHGERNVCRERTGQRSMRHRQRRRGARGPEREPVCGWNGVNGDVWRVKLHLELRRQQRRHERQLQRTASVHCDRERGCERHVELHQPCNGGQHDHLHGNAKRRLPNHLDFGLWRNGNGGGR